MVARCSTFEIALNKAITSPVFVCSGPFSSTSERAQRSSVYQKNILSIFTKTLLTAIQPDQTALVEVSLGNATYLHTRYRFVFASLLFYSISRFPLQ